MVNAHKRRRVLCTLGVAAAGLILLLAGVPALATDGVIEINQAKVMARGGFPFQITQSGSYRLTSNLVVSNADTTAISVKVSHVTIDLNGFSIIGPGTTGSGVGIDAFGNGITIYNGEVSGMGSFGIIAGGGSRIERVRAFFNYNSGIACYQDCSGLCGKPGCDVSHNISNHNALGIDIIGGSAYNSSNITHNITQFNGYGIFVGQSISSLVSDNTANHNNTGIYTVEGSVMVRHNTVNYNDMGLVCNESIVGYIDNVLSSNPGGNVFPDGLRGSCVNLGHNLCDTSVCP